MSAVFGIEPRIAIQSDSAGESAMSDEVERVPKRRSDCTPKAARPRHRRPDPVRFRRRDVGRTLDNARQRSRRPGEVFIFPDLDADNNALKAVQRSAHAVAVGPVLQGVNEPVNDLSRGSTVAAIVNTVAITAIQAQEQ